MDSVSALKQELQRHLNHARAYVRLDFPEGCRLNVADRQGGGLFVLDGEKFPAELKFLLFRQPDVLERRYIPVHVSRSNQRIAAFVAKLLYGRVRVLVNSLEGIHVEPLRRRTRSRVWIAHTVRPVAGKSRDLRRLPLQ